MERAAVLIIEKDFETRESLVEALHTRGFAAWGCPSPGTAMDLLPTVQPSLVMVDLDVEPLTGWELLRVCKEASANIRVIVHGQNLSEETAFRAKANGADAVVSKRNSIKSLLGLTCIEPQVL